MGIKLIAKGFLSSLFIWFEFVLEHFDQSVAKCLRWDFRPCLRGIKLRGVVTPLIIFVFADFLRR